MAKILAGVDPHQLTVVARRVLLDGLTALRAHIDAITVVGAQAAYLRTPNATIASAAYTSDADLGVDPERLGDQPLVDEALRAAGSSLLYANQPGLWARSEKVGEKVVPIELDILIGESLVLTGKRSAKIPHTETCLPAGSRVSKSLS